MRRMLIGLAIGLTAFASSAWAEGPIVRWDQVIGVTGHESDTGLVVGGIGPAQRWITVRDGRVILNLETGFVSINVEGVSYARHYGLPGGGILAPLGGPVPASSQRCGTFVCNATTESPVQVGTDTFHIEQGSVFYRGFLPTVPEECREHPEDIVFLLHTPDNGTYLAFGAARTIQ